MRVGEFKISSISLISSKNSQNAQYEFKYDFNLEFNSSKKPWREKKKKAGQFKQKRQAMVGERKNTICIDITFSNSQHYLVAITHYIHNLRYNITGQQFGE
jgi:uncharacterized membrane protein